MLMAANTLTFIIQFLKLKLKRKKGNIPVENDLVMKIAIPYGYLLQHHRANERLTFLKSKLE
jgi:hypothetical protein